VGSASTRWAGSAYRSASSRASTRPWRPARSPGPSSRRRGPPASASAPSGRGGREGPITLGLVPERYRAERIAALQRWADFATWIEAPAIITHCGFIPENLTDPTYPAVVAAIGDVAGYCAERGVGFWFETGQETPVVLLRTIRQLGLPNLGINLDPANLLMYGKGNPIDALSLLGSYVRNIHVKDGLYPTDGEHLGREVPVGQGQVDYPRFIAELAAIGFTGDYIIEREIGGDQQVRDIQQTIADLRRWGKSERPL